MTGWTRVLLFVFLAALLVSSVAGMVQNAATHNLQCELARSRLRTAQFAYQPLPVPDVGDRDYIESIVEVNKERAAAYQDFLRTAPLCR